METIKLEKNTEPTKLWLLLMQIIKIEKDTFSGNAWHEDFFRELIENDFDFIMVAIESGRILGFGVIRCLPDAEILSLAVVEEERRKGIGSVILREMINQARSVGCKNIFLEVRSKNIPAQRMYETNNFEVIGKRKDYYSDPTDDAFVMRYIC